MPARRSPARRSRFAALLVLILAVAATDLVPTSALQSSNGDAQVIAQGLAAPPADRVAWRVVQQEIPARIDARPSNRLPSSTGFLLADANSIFVTDQRTKLRTRLSPGEAQFVPSGANQTWANLDEGEGTAYTLELVDREVVKSTPDGEVMYNSGSFRMNPGDYDLDLIRANVPGGERSSVPGAGLPTLVLITAGSVEVTSSRNDERVRLEAGEAVAIRGELTIRPRGDDTATYVAAMVGDAVSGGGDPVPTAEPTSTREPRDEREDRPTRTPSDEEEEDARPTRTPNPESDDGDDDEPDKPGINDGASVRIAVRLCRQDMTYFDFNPRGCRRADGDFQLALVRPDGERLRMSDASRAGPTFVRWSGLNEGVYVLVVGKMPDGYLSYSLDGFICCTANEGYEITIDDDSVIDGTLYLFQRPFGEGAPPRPAPTAAPQPTSQPVNPEPGVDTDGDGLSDLLELEVFGTSPTLIDSDGDTIPDGTEAFGWNGWLTAPALPDTDHDGVDDNVEISQGTNPLDPQSN